MFRSFVACFLLILALLPAVAGGGPSGVLVLFDKDDANSLVVANAYQRARGIPERNMIPVAFAESYDDRTLWDLVEYLRAQITARGLAGQVQAFALAGYVPLHGGQDRSSYSLASALYLSPNFDRAHPLKGADNAAYRLPPAEPTIALNGYTPVREKTYWPVSYVGPTDRAALSAEAAMRVIMRAPAADGSKPGGVIYWPLNGDIRSTTRETEIARTLPLWDALGIKYSLPDGIWLQNRGDIAGGVVGIASLDVNQGNHYLPGAWVDHLTSFGGVLQGDWQMPCTDFLLAGADGSAGTMGEPYAIAEKFPDAHIHTHLRAGASLAEAFWESIGTPYEILPVGDPLLQPYADFPKITVKAPRANAVVRGVVRVQATATGARALEPALDLFLDGRKVRIGESTEPIKATRRGSELLLDTTGLPDGWHELRVAAYNADPVRTQAETAVPILVNNHEQSVKLSGPAQVTYTGTPAFTVTLSHLPKVTGVSLRANGRVLATQPAAGTLALSGTQLPFTGACRVFAVVTLHDGSEVWSAP